MSVIMLDKERHPRMGFKEMREYKELTGLSLINGVELAKMNEDQLLILCWISLRSEDPTLTKEQVDAMLDYPDILELTVNLFKKKVKEPDPLASIGPSAK